MNEHWKEIVITNVRLAVYVASDSGRSTHKDRAFHGFVLNDTVGEKNYCFEDGRVLKTAKNSLFYLPKGSSYWVETVQSGGCYAINFDAPLSDEPFVVSLSNADSLRMHFKSAADAWKQKDDARLPLAMCALYAAIAQAKRESQRKYVSGDQRSLILPAIATIGLHFNEKDLSVHELAQECGISEVYFRRLFFNFLGVSPKEYIIQKRIEYAKALLADGSFSVSEIASLCGYDEPCHFSREFARRVGVPPSRFGEQ